MWIFDDEDGLYYDNAGRTCWRPDLLTAGPVDGRNPEETRDFDWNFRLFTRYEQEADK